MNKRQQFCLFMEFAPIAAVEFTRNIIQEKRKTVLPGGKSAVYVIKVVSNLLCTFTIPMNLRRRTLTVNAAVAAMTDW